MVEFRTRVFNAFVSSTKVYVSSTKRVRLLMRSLSRNPRKKNRNYGEKFLYNLISSRDGAEEVQKQGSDERTQEDYPICCELLQMYGSLIAFFHLCLVCVLFSAPSLPEMKFHRNFFPPSLLQLGEKT